MKKIIFISIIIIGALFLTVVGLRKILNQNANQANEVNNNQSINTEQGNVNNGAQTEKNITITIKDFKFIPETAIIKDGVIITWKNQDNASHQIVSDQEPQESFLPSLQSYILAPGQEWSYTFDGRGIFGLKWDEEYGGQGTYSYHCQLHPQMKGQIKVIK